MKTKVSMKYSKRKAPTEKPPAGNFQANPPLNHSEKKLFWALNKLGKDKYHIFPKMRLCDVIKNTNRMDLYRILSKHVDFMLYTKKDFTPVCAIELDGHHHEYGENFEHDQVKDFYLNAAQIPVVRLQPENYYQPEEIDKRINDTPVVSNLQYPINAKTQEDMAFDDAVTSTITIPTGEIKKRVFDFCAGIGAFALAYIVWKIMF